MIKTFKKISIAAAALMMVACSSQDTAENRPAAGRQVQFTATIAAPNSATRTVYSEVTTGDAAGTIDVAWKAGDKIALIHNAVKDVVEVEAVNADGSATITGTITVGTDGEKVEVCYPAALWEWDNTTSGAIRNATFVTNITKQDGTLGYIQDNLDVRMGAGTLKVSGDKATLSANVTLASQIAIWKLNLQDNATPTPAALQATKVTMKVDRTPEPVAIAGTTTLGTATSTIYLGLDKFTNEKVIIEATVGSDTYKYEKEGVSLALGKYYQSTVTMAKAAAYLKWNAGQKQLVATPFPETITTVTSSTTTWSAGTYVVEGNVDITGDITLTGNVDLIIKDGAKLKVNMINGYNYSSNYNLSIYGQTEKSGQLVVNSSSGAISNINTLEVHSAKVTATSSGSDRGGFNLISIFNVYGGSVYAEHTGDNNGYGIRLSGSGPMNIFGGDVTAVGKGNNDVLCYGIMSMSSVVNVTVYGGKLRAECATNKALKNITLIKDAGYTSGKIQTCDDGSSWADYTGATTPETKYVRVGY